MDKIFYSVEDILGVKALHIFAEIYDAESDEDKGYRLSEFSGIYLDFEDVEEYGVDFLNFIYADNYNVYEKPISKAEAEKCCKTYFSGKPGTELNIYNCNQNTPCGDYWCDI